MGEETTPTNIQPLRFSFSLMALYSQATDLCTKKTIWVSTNVVKNRPQFNSHRSETMKAEGIDGFSAAEIANLHTDYEGWQHSTPRYYCNPEAPRISFTV